MARLPRPSRVSNKHKIPPEPLEMAPKKPKNHRQGIAGGFGDLQQSARVSSKT